MVLYRVCKNSTGNLMIVILLHTVYRYLNWKVTLKSTTLQVEYFKSRLPLIISQDYDCLTQYCISNYRSQLHKKVIAII